jgi:predicted secreted protein
VAGLVNGSDLVLYMKRNPLGYIPVAFSTELQLEIEGDIIDQTNKDSQGWRELITGTRNYTINITSLYENFRFAGYMDWFKLMEDRTPVKFQFKLRSGGSHEYIGDAYVVSLNLKGETETGSEYQCFLSGTSFIQETN